MNDDFDFGLYDERVIIPSVKEEIITEKETVVVQEEIPEKEEEISLELCKLFISGLKRETTRDTIKSHFSQFGEVLECNLVKDPITQVSRGFGFITFTHPKVLDRVLKQDHFLDDKLLDTKRTEPRKDGKQDVVEKIFVGGLPLHIDMETLKEYFEGFGTVLDTRLMLDKMTGTSRGFGYVTFEDVETIREILEKQQKSGIRIGGKKVDIKYARAKQLVKEFQPPAPRKRAPSVQEKIIKIPRYDDNGTPYSLPESLVVFGNPVFAKVDDGDIVLPKWPFDHPLEEVVVLNKI